MDELLRTDGMPIADGMAECRLLNLARILAASSAMPASLPLLFPLGGISNLFLSVAVS